MEILDRFPGKPIVRLPRDISFTTETSVEPLRVIECQDNFTLLMRDRAVRRLLVCDDDQGLVGVVSIGDLAERIDPDSVLGGISSAEPNN